MKACLILPYFGKFNGYFQIWLNSCRINKSIDWYIFTDDKRSFEYPENVKVHYCTFEKLQKKIKDIFGNNIVIDEPYHLCKYRVAYYEIFNDIVSSYDYWGYCDCDLIWGDISSMIEKPMLEGIPKISWKGHFTIIKNDLNINILYKNVVPDCKTFQGCISRDDKSINLFDEVGINKIFDFYNQEIFRKLMIADLQVKPFNFICNHFSPEYTKEHICEIFEWDNGKLYCCYAYKNIVYKEEFAYIHFLRREIENRLSGNNSNHFLIIPNMLIDYEDVTYDKIVEWSKPRFYSSYYKKRLKWNYLKKIFVEKIKCTGQSPDKYLYTIK